MKELLFYTLFPGDFSVCQFLGTFEHKIHSVSNARFRRRRTLTLGNSFNKDVGTFPAYIQSRVINICYIGFMVIDTTARDE